MLDFLLPHGLRSASLICLQNSPARILEWIAISFSRWAFQFMNWNPFFCVLEFCLSVLPFQHFFFLVLQYKSIQLSAFPIINISHHGVGLPRWHLVKNSPANARDIKDVGSTPGLGRCPGGGHGNPLHYSCLGNLMDRGAWLSTIHGVAKSWT